VSSSSGSDDVIARRLEPTGEHLRARSRSPSRLHEV
jgi:hypothetical protein